MSQDYKGTITLASVSDGTPGIAIPYVISSNTENIHKHYNTGDGTLQFYSNLEFWVNKVENQQSTLLDPNIDYDSAIEVVGSPQFGNLWGLFNRLTYSDISTDPPTQYNILEYIREVNTTTKKIILDFSKLVSITSPEGSEVDKTSFNNLKELILKNNIYLNIIIYTYKNTFSPSQNDYLSNKPIGVIFDTPDDMAKFRVTATNIQAAVEETKLKFDSTGLTVQNGGIRIVDSNEHLVFGYDEDVNKLIVKGEGTFTGIIHASDGDFIGNVTANTLTANSGSIGGFIITDEGLFSKDSETGLQNNQLQLYGTGKVYANSIILGIGAKIEQYINLGSEKTRLWNPQAIGNENNYVLETENTKLNEDGILTVGNIKLDGITSSIFGEGYSLYGNNYPSDALAGLAEFKNINASGKISTMVFEQNHVQSVGGSMLFKPSYKIISKEGNRLLLDLEQTTDGYDFDGSIGDYVYIVNKDGRIVSEDSTIKINNIEDNYVTISSELEGEEDLNSLIVIGKYNDLIIGINSSSVGKGYLKPRGFTITDFNVPRYRLITSDSRFLITSDENGQVLVIDQGEMTIADNPKVFLGDLDAAGIKFGDEGTTTKGYGLYSENVYLTGSLTTKVTTGSSSTYAGVNTLNGATANKFGIEDTSKIVFWAGSEGTSNNSISNALFQVTEAGSIYAARGKFTGSVIVDAEITGAIITGTDIYTARIHGKDGGKLSFYDTSKGIVFYNGDYNGVEVDNSVETFSIGTNGLTFSNQYFIELSTTSNNAQITFTGDNFNTKSNSTYLNLNQGHIYSKIEDKIISNITFTESQIGLGNGETQQQLIIDSNKIIQLKDTIEFDDNMKYEKANGGYNLYVL